MDSDPERSLKGRSVSYSDLSYLQPPFRHPVIFHLLKKVQFEMSIVGTGEFYNDQQPFPEEP